MHSHEYLELDPQVFDEIISGFAPGPEVPGWAGVIPADHWTSSSQLGPSGGDPTEYLAYGFSDPKVEGTFGDDLPRVWTIELWQFCEVGRTPSVTLPHLLDYLVSAVPAGWQVLSHGVETRGLSEPTPSRMRFQRAALRVRVDPREVTP